MTDINDPTLVKLLSVDLFFDIDVYTKIEPFTLRQMAIDYGLYEDEVLCRVTAFNKLGKATRGKVSSKTAVNKINKLFSEDILRTAIFLEDEKYECDNQDTMTIYTSAYNNSGFKSYISFLISDVSKISEIETFFRDLCEKYSPMYGSAALYILDHFPRVIEGLSKIQELNLTHPIHSLNINRYEGSLSKGIVNDFHWLNYFSNKYFSKLQLSSLRNEEVIDNSEEGKLIQLSKGPFLTEEELERITLLRSENTEYLDIFR
ncbi:hypothetical protein [Agaribacter marinus]|nr:hypothetical protein [Agaribacter marinus]